MHRRREQAPAGRPPLQHPARLITTAFAGAIAAGTLLLMLPLSRTGEGGATLMEAMFTASSAVTVTGLGIVDTAEHWTPLGEGVILFLIQLGGLGIMTFATLVLARLGGRIGLRRRMLAQHEVGVLTLGEVREVIRVVLLVTVAVEVGVALVLTAWFAGRYDEPVLRALWLGVFHSVSAFNNAGFALYPDSLMRFATDPVVNGCVILAVTLGGLGVPVIGEVLRRRWSWSRWSLHTKLVLTASAALLLSAWILVCVFEWTNGATLGPLSTPSKLLVGLFQAMTPRTAGFNTLDYGVMRETTWLLTAALMFIGASPASTGGGIKVTTFAMLGFVILSEMRGDRDVNLFQRRIPTPAQRQALAIALVGVGVVFASTLALIEFTGLGLGRTLFEVTSALGTVGLTTGVTAGLPTEGKLLLVILMFAGRVGPLTVGTALAVRSRDQRFRHAEERPLIG